MNLPNKLTLLRIILVPVFLAVLYWGFPGADYAALAIFIIASLTDLLDGKIARKYNLVTDFGKFADPRADNILVVAARLWFVEFAVSGLRMIASDNGRVIAAGWSGKVKTASSMVCIVVMLAMGPVIESYIQSLISFSAPFPPIYIAWIDPLCGWIITLTTLYSGVEYFVKNKDVIRSA